MYDQQCDGRLGVPLKSSVTIARSVPGSVAWLTVIFLVAELLRGSPTATFGGSTRLEKILLPPTLIVTVSVADAPEMSKRRM
jgi:hypothetical protein